MSPLHHNDYHNLLAQLAEAHLTDSPHKAEHALRLADYLEEVGRPAHAEMIRLHHDQLTTWQKPGEQDGGIYSNMPNQRQGNTQVQSWQHDGLGSDFGTHHRFVQMTLENGEKGHHNFFAVLPTKQAHTLVKAIRSENPDQVISHLE